MSLSKGLYYLLLFDTSSSFAKYGTTFTYVFLSYDSLQLRGTTERRNAKHTQKVVRIGMCIKIAEVF